jgi:hypothetical protein
MLLAPTERKGPSITRYLVGGGQAEIRLPAESQAIAPSRELLQQVGLANKPIDP